MDPEKLSTVAQRVGVDTRVLVYVADALGYRLRYHDKNTILIGGDDAKALEERAKATKAWLASVRAGNAA